MIFTILLSIITGLIVLILNIMPPITFTAPDVSGLSSILGVGYWFVNSTILNLFFASLFFWGSFQLVSGLTKFVYRKVPGVN